ncbi:hypothetical protein WJX82_008438 [Trebouxia sp. C0006]
MAPVWLSCIILFLLGGIVGATGGIVGLVSRHRKLQKAKYSVTESLYGGQYQTAASQAQDSQYKSSWQGPPSASHSGLTMAPPSSNAASSLDRQYVNKSPVGQRLLQEDAIRQSGVSGPLGMGVVMQSMSREAGELQRTASPKPFGPSDGYSKGPPTVSSTANSPELVPEDSFPAALADNSLIAARHRHHEAKENITAALNPAYSHEKTMMPEQSVVRSPPARSYALQAIQASSNPGANANTLVAARGPAIMQSDMRIAEFTSVPPLAPSDSPGVQPRGASSSAPVQGMLAQPIARSAGSPSDQLQLPMAPPPPRQMVAERPLLPSSPPLPAMSAGQVSSSAPQLPPLSAQVGRSTGAAAPAPPPPPPPPMKSGGGVRAPPPPPPPPPAGGLSQLGGQPPRAPAPPTRTTQQNSAVLQGQASAAGTNKPNAGVAARPPGGNVGGVLSMAEQAAQMAARRVKPPTVPVAATQSSSTTVTSSSTLTPGPAGPVSFRDGPNVVTASAAHKHVPSDAYELEDLDEDWVAMLNVLDNRLLEVGRPTMMAKERAVAVRSLLVSTGREKPDIALQNAIEDIERYRRIH